MSIDFGNTPRALGKYGALLANANGPHGKTEGTVRNLAQALGHSPKAVNYIARGYTQAKAAAGVSTHHADVPQHGSGAHGGNPNHDEHGRFA